MLHVDITIVGAGVIGLAVALALSDKSKSVVVVEKETGPGKETSSRNSEVIHAGIYYPTGSLKAHLCVKGSSMLYEFCEKHEIPFLPIGKVIVAASGQEEPSIEGLWKQGMENGVPGLMMLTRLDLNLREPHVSGVCALYSPCTGILDSHRLIRRLEGLSLNQGCTIVYNSNLSAINAVQEGYLCSVETAPSEGYTFTTRVLINAAGLHSDTVASLAGISVDEAGYRIYPVKGQYFRVRGKKQGLVNGLVYPSPGKSLTGLGIHVTKDLSGSVRLGPDARYVNEISYDVNPSHAKYFLESAKRLLPFLDEDDLMPDMAGIRPKIQPPGGEVRDFVIRHEADRGLFGLINLIGIESPGLTSCLAIGEMVKGLLKDAGLL
ncbi:MAG TPA: NAD(P)/FAD-dependent oxidoreductase [Desulfomonilia bacterium]|nr:NAD(P)/FAD-dependent oxidoreductase [Desulfomonilia bacterium]